MKKTLPYFISLLVLTCNNDNAFDCLQTNGNITRGEIPSMENSFTTLDGIKRTLDPCSANRHGPVGTLMPNAIANSEIPLTAS